MKSPVEKLIEYIDTHCPEKKLSMSDRDYYLFAEKRTEQEHLQRAEERTRGRQCARRVQAIWIKS